MMRKTHDQTAISFILLFYIYVSNIALYLLDLEKGSNFGSRIILTLILGIGVLLTIGLPDLDNPNSTISRRNKFFSKIVIFLGGKTKKGEEYKHRKFLHNSYFYLLICVIIIAITFFLYQILGLAINNIDILIIANIISIFRVYLIVFIIGILIGWGLHLIFDAMTPASIKGLKFLRFFNIRTGGYKEKILRLILIIANIYLILKIFGIDIFELVKVIIQSKM